jgi:hypothetical protein
MAQLAFIVRVEAEIKQALKKPRNTGKRKLCGLGVTCCVSTVPAIEHIIHL